MALPWTCHPSLGEPEYAALVQRAIFDCCKWHTQAEDRAVLCGFPLVLDARVWAELRELAANLARETLAAESELLGRVDLHEHLGLPAPLRRCLRQIPRLGATPGGARVMRFDFHWTTEGWRISEANTDAAGGFIESSGVTALMAEHYPDCRPTGDPAGTFSAAVLRATRPGATVGLMHMTIYSEDAQMMLYLSRRLQELGLLAHLFSPEQVRWVHGHASVDCDWYRGPVDLVFRFIPAEWLPRLPSRTGWEKFLFGGRSAVCNPAYAVFTQSKRFPLVWDQLSTPLPTWRALLPPTYSPREIGGVLNEDWVLKPALGHEGHNVGIQGVNDPADWQRIQTAAARDPDHWAAQRRFSLLPLTTPDGLFYPCLGIYVIDGQVAGAYGRLADRALIDERCRDVTVLVRNDMLRTG